MEQAVVGTGGNGVRQFFRRKGVVLTVGVAAFVVIAGVGVIVWQATSGNGDSDSAVTAALKASQSAYSQGAFAVSVSALGGMDQKATKKSDKVAVYNQLAISYTAEGKLDDALHNYTLKHQLDPASAKTDAQVVGSLYERKGDTAQAISQYTIALNYYKSLSNANQQHMEIATLEGQIASLQEGQ